MAFERKSLPSSFAASSDVLQPLLNNISTRYDNELSCSAFN